MAGIRLTVHRAFEIGIGLKAANAALECIGGVALLLVPSGWFTSFAVRLTQHELQEDPRDLVANHLLGLARSFSPAITWYYALYLLAHGVVKLALVGALVKGWLWAYPASLIVLAGFIAYQLYQYSLSHALGLIALSALDLVVMWLIWREYLDVRKRRV